MTDAPAPLDPKQVEACAGGEDARAVLELLESTPKVVGGVGSTEPPKSGAPASPARERK